MNKKDLNIAKELKKKLIKNIPIISLKIFGSRVYDKADPYSDMDVFVEVKN